MEPEFEAWSEQLSSLSPYLYVWEKWLWKTVYQPSLCASWKSEISSKHGFLYSATEYMKTYMSIVEFGDN